MATNSKDKAPIKRKGSRATFKEDMGRPRAKIIQDGETEEAFWAKVDNWLMKGVSGVTIAGRLGVHEDTFIQFGVNQKRWGKGTKYSTFSAYKQFRVIMGDDTLRERQYDAAVGIFGHKEVTDKEGNTIKSTVAITKPSTTMLMWLGKNRLGQSDTVDITTNGEAMNQVAPTVIVKRIVNIRADKKPPKSER